MLNLVCGQLCHSEVLRSNHRDLHVLCCASTADITSGLQLGMAEVLRGLRNFLNMDRPEHHCIDRLKEGGVEKRSGGIPPSEVRNDQCSPDKHWHYFECNLGETAERQGEAHMGLSERYDAILS